MFCTTRDALENLGAALYVHRALSKQAEKAKEAVDYFNGVGVLNKQAATYYFDHELEPGKDVSLARIRAAELNPVEKEILRKHYGLSRNVNIEDENESRGRWARRLGGAAGALGAGLIGALGMGALLRAAPEVDPENFVAAAGAITGLIGGKLGARFAEDKATKKYSLEGLKKVLEARKGEDRQHTLSKKAGAAIPAAIGAFSGNSRGMSRGSSAYSEENAERLVNRRKRAAD